VNNIILQEDSFLIAGNDETGITFDYNNWSKTRPSHCQRSGDIIDNPLLDKTGPTGSGSLSPARFKILEISPARDRAQVRSQVTEDFFKTRRESAPDIGGHEILVFVGVNKRVDKYVVLAVPRMA